MCWTHIDKFTKMHSAAAAKELALFQAKQVYAMKNVVKKEMLDCDLVLTRCCEVFVDQKDADDVKETYDNQVNAGLDYIQDVYYVGPKYAARVSSHPCPSNLG